MTAPFTRPPLVPASPTWIVRQVGHLDAVELVFVGHANRAELDSQVERLARWPWNLEEGGFVTVLADAHADPIGVRVVHCTWTADEIRELLVDLFSIELVSQAFGVGLARKVARVDGR